MHKITTNHSVHAWVHARSLTGFFEAMLKALNLRDITFCRLSLPLHPSMASCEWQEEPGPVAIPGLSLAAFFLSLASMFAGQH